MSLISNMCGGRDYVDLHIQYVVTHQELYWFKVGEGRVHGTFYAK